MQKSTRFGMLSLLVAVVVGQGCSTAKVRVMPGEDGMNKVEAADIEKDDAQEAAVDAANDYCKKQNKQAIFMKEDVAYTGSMDEGARDTIRKASRVAGVLGANQHMANPGGGVGPNVFDNARSAGHAATNDRDYKSTVVFKCQ